MENYVVSARKYRPHAFREVVGQRHITDTLERAIDNNHLAQAMLFCGPRGVGKTTCARIVARMINEVSGGDPDQDYSLNIFELDAASNNSVDDIRNLIDQVRFAPQVGEYKVYIIDEVHMLSQSAFNAFLKTLEEPPKHAIFILATTEKHKIIPTILSRCQIFDFKRIGVDDIANHLEYVAEQEGIKSEPQALHTIALKADGALRDSLSIFDRIVSFSENEITYQGVIDNLNILDYDFYFRTIDHVLEVNNPGLFMLFNEILEKGFDGHMFINGLASHVRDLLVCKDAQTVELLEVSSDVKSRYLEQSKKCTVRNLFHWLKVLNECDIRYKTSNNKRLLVEIALIQLTQPTQAPQPEKKNIEPIAQKQETPLKREPLKHYEPEPVAAKEQQSIAKELPKTATPDAPNPFKKENKTVGKKRIGGTGFSLNSLSAGHSTKKDSEEDQEVEIDYGSQEFSQEQLEKVWRKLTRKYEKNKTFSTALNNGPRLTENYKIIITLDNKIQESLIQDFKPELLAFLRENLKNNAVSLDQEIRKTDEVKSIYTPEEKFKHMAEKNPALIKLKNKLDLNF